MQLGTEELFEGWQHIQVYTVQMPGYPAGQL